ncbi:MAG: helix-turn-helix domain-containing protein [Planctomycetes bacterium]|nr:helix-turn-helix domain-containing protein [Planctomycetota bacterium]
MYPIKKTAELLGLNPESVRRLIRRGDLQAYKIPPDAKRPTYRVSQNAIDGFLVKCDPKTFRPLPRKSSRPHDTVPDWVSMFLEKSV